MTVVDNDISPTFGNGETPDILSNPETCLPNETGKADVSRKRNECRTFSPTPALFDRSGEQPLLCSLCASFLLVPGIFGVINSSGVAFERNPGYLMSAARLCGLCSLLLKLQNEKRWDSFNTEFFPVSFGLKGIEKAKLGGYSVLLSLTLGGCILADFRVVSIEGESSTSCIAARVNRR